MAETMNEPVCILSLNFKDAFDRMAHSYLLYQVSEQYGFGPVILNNIRILYEQFASKV
jgi:hypothetical protein